MKSLSEDFGADEVYIVGGGKSLEGFDFDRLKDKVTIGCNRAAFDAGTKILISIDRTFMNRFKPEIDNFDGLVCLARKTDIEFDRCRVDRRYTYVRDSRMSLRLPYLYGLHTGHAAVNLAALEGFKKINMLGIDLCEGGHWHESYAWSRGTASFMNKWAMDLTLAKEYLDKMGVEVFNYSDRSAVEGYQLKSLESI